MRMQHTAERLVREGFLTEGLRSLEDDIRARPSDVRLRVFLAQLLCVRGEWDRALEQLAVASDLDSSVMPFAQVYGDGIRSEQHRARVFAGDARPDTVGEAEEWLEDLIGSLVRAGCGDAAGAEALRQRAFDEAPVSPGEINGERFEWIADGDSRLGPVLEAVIGGRYHWVPFAHVRHVAIEPPTDLRDLVWAPAHLQLYRGDEILALIPVRYPGSETAKDSALAMARRTDWREAGPDVYHGLGQRMLASDASEFSFLEVRTLSFGGPAPFTAATSIHG